METWKAVVGFEGLYEVSSWGQVRRVAGETSNGRRWSGGLLSPSRNKYGYVKYTLTREGKPHYKVAHRIVCEAFNGPAPPGRNLVLHRDDNPRNNTPQNLYWGNLSDNQQDIIRNGNNHGRNKTQCKQGHPYTEENTYTNRKTGSRSCQKCRRDSARRSNQEKRGKKWKK